MPASVTPARYAHVIVSAMSARSDALAMTRFARLFASASKGITTRAAAATAIPRTEVSGFRPTARPPTEVRTTYRQRRINKDAETRAVVRSIRSIPSVERPLASKVSRRQRTIPLDSSITESKPNAVSSTLRAAMPAPMASAASTAIHNTVTTSRRTPRRRAAPRVAAVFTLLAAAGHQEQWALAAVCECPTDIAEQPVAHAVVVVAADDDQLRAELVRLGEDELGKLVWPVAADIHRGVHPRFDEAGGDALAESKRLRN